MAENASNQSVLTGQISSNCNCSCISIHDRCVVPVRQANRSALSLVSQIDSGHFPDHLGINLLRLASDGGWQDRHNTNSHKVALVSRDL